ncbi:hypothetical protein [Rhodospirillaceae bacterium SYSU D60014]|uniref:hypothetical protein n=1 Tax=Virgifigura deserti TaxID=2268457 RepID=UPI000E665349
MTAAFLDRPAARVLALLCFALCVALLAYIHRDDLFPRAVPETAGNDLFARCFAERAAGIDKMRAEGVIDESQEALFKSRAEALCRAQTQEDGLPPGAPPLPQ